MKYGIEKEDTGLLITIEAAGEREEQLVDVLRNCHRSAQQACNAECAKIAAFEQRPGDRLGVIHLHLLARSGEQLDAERVGRCLNSLWKFTDKS